MSMYSQARACGVDPYDGERNEAPIYPEGAERAQFERWWLSLCEEAEQGPTPEEETFAWAAWQYRAAIARGDA